MKEAAEFFSAASLCISSLLLALLLEAFKLSFEESIKVFHNLNDFFNKTGD